MFSLPQAKKVRREELYSPSFSRPSSPDPELDQLFRNRIRQEYQTVGAHENNLGNVAVAVDDEEGDAEEVEFRLFAPSSKAATSILTKIRLLSPAADDRPPGLINPERPRSYYFQDSLSPKLRQQLQFAAVSGAEVIARAKTPCPGLSLPWRVTTIIAKGVSISTDKSAVTNQTNVPRKKKRIGKKSRIAIRQKIAKDSERLEKERQAAAEKALGDRMKRAKRNKEKKQKKRERDKVKKLAEDGQSKDIAGETFKSSEVDRIS